MGYNTAPGMFMVIGMMKIFFGKIDSSRGFFFCCIGEGIIVISPLGGSLILVLLRLVHEGNAYRKPQQSQHHKNAADKMEGFVCMHSFFHPFGKDTGTDNNDKSRLLANCNFFITDLQFFRFGGQMVVLSPEGIPAEDHQPDGDRGEDGNDDDPDDGVIDVFFACCINIGNGAINKFINNERGYEQKKQSKISFKGIHTILFFVSIMSFK